MSSKEAIKQFHDDLEVCRTTGKPVEELYNKWAQKYDDLHPTGKYINSHAADTIAKLFTDKNISIADIACGTGMTSKYLNEHGFNNIHGFDLSSEMVNVAKVTGYYNTVSIGCISDKENLNCEKESFDAVVCISGISFNHIKLENALKEFYRILKPGGYGVYTSSVCNIIDVLDTHRSYLADEKFEFKQIEKRFHFENVRKNVDEQCFFCVMKKKS